MQGRGGVSICPQNLPKVFFGKGYKAKIVAYLGNGTFGRFLLIRASAKLSHYPMLDSTQLFRSILNHNS
jgi:hypothetical protein